MTELKNTTPDSEKEDEGDEETEANCDNCGCALYRHQDLEMNEGGCKMCNCARFTFIPSEPPKNDGGCLGCAYGSGDYCGDGCVNTEFQPKSLNPPNP